MGRLPFDGLFTLIGIDRKFYLVILSDAIERHAYIEPVGVIFGNAVLIVQESETMSFATVATGYHLVAYDADCLFEILARIFRRS